MGNNQIAMGNNQIANGISPSPSGEVRWGLDGSMRSNNYFPPRLRITNRKRLPVQPVYLGLSLVFFCEVVTRSPPIPVIQVDCRELALVRATCVAGIKP